MGISCDMCPEFPLMYCMSATSQHKTLGRPCLVHGRLDSGKCRLYLWKSLSVNPDPRALSRNVFIQQSILGPVFPKHYTSVREMNYDEYVREREGEREGKSQRNLYMYCNFCRACNITWLLLIKSSDSVVQINHLMYWMGFFLILSLISQYIMEWLVKLLPLFCVILLSLD